MEGAADYKLVYQGGHHNVYCNGENHLRTFGGTCHDVDHQTMISNALKSRFIRKGRAVYPALYQCDCEAWANGEEPKGYFIDTGNKCR